MEGPHPVNLLNTNFNDVYFSFDLNLDSDFFISNIDTCMIFSSDRPDGLGGFDLYFTGLEIPE
jgi:hypothetical protein